MRRIKSQFKLKGHKVKDPEVYLGASLSKIENDGLKQALEKLGRGVLTDD